MKKATFLMVLAVAAGFTSCATSPKAELKSDVDSLSYAFGLSQTSSLKNYLVYQRRIDTTYMDEFLKGVQEAANKKLPANAKDSAYMVGLEVGQMIGQQWIPGVSRELFGADSKELINKNNVLAGFIAGALGEKTDMTVEEARMYFEKTMQDIQKKNTEKKYADNRTAGEQFLAENKTKEGVQTTSSGLQFKVLKEGKGAIPTKTSKVKVHYKGTLIDGTEFDSSFKRKEPTTFAANQVIPGWTEALTMMPVGSKWELYIPQDLAYGDREMGKIKPYSTLIFEVELIEIVEENKKK